MNIARALNIRGWMTEPELHLLAEQATKHARIVEAGSYCGRSSRVLADNTPGHVYCVDPWDGMCQTYGITTYSNGYNREMKEFVDNLKDHIMDGRVTVHRMKFTDFYIDNPDMIFLDAIHEYEPLKRDIIHALSLMKSGLLCGHDYCDNWPDVVRIVDEIFPVRKVQETIWYVEL